MKNLTLSAIATLALTTFAVAESYPAYGPDSYAAKHHEGSYAHSNSVEKHGDMSTAYSDVDRQGFRLAIGAGGAHTNIDNYYWNGEDISSTGFATSFEIGYAPSNQLSIQYMNNVNWGSSDSEISGVSAIVLNYYLENTPETFYLVGGVGGSVYDDGFGDAEVAGIIGVGYAMDKFEFEVDGVFNQYYDENMMQFFVTVSYRIF
jgi:hypothetical protein